MNKFFVVMYTVFVILITYTDVSRVSVTILAATNWEIRISELQISNCTVVLY